LPNTRIKASRETDSNRDLKAIEVPTLVMQGETIQIVPYKDASCASELIKNRL